MPLDPRTPVLVGGGQLSNRIDRGDPVLEPVDLIAEAARRAADDTGAADPAKVLAAVGSVRVVHLLSWHQRDPGRLVGERIGATDLRHTIYTTPGGNTPQALVNRTCLDIARGDVDVAAIGGAEAWRTRTSLKSAGERPQWTVEPEDATPTETFGGDMDMRKLVHPLELSRGIVAPIQLYPMFESALRAAAGATHGEWAARLGDLWSRFSEVAASNPHAWIQQSFTPEELATPTADNRMIGFPYTKRMNSNNAVEQGAAVLVCSVEAAERLGIPRERWVFPWSGTDAHDAEVVSERGDMHTSPAIRVAGGRALALAGVGADDIAHVDLYSCFPSAVEVAAGELGLSLDRQLTVTGGLSFAGGPWNNYVSHAVATMLGVLRDDPGSLGLVTGNGGFLTKHAFGVYGTEPPPAPFRWEKPQDEVDAAAAACAVAEGYVGAGVVEAYTVMHDRDGAPEAGLCAVRTPDGTGRTWGTVRDPDVLAAMEAEEFVGRSTSIDADGALAF